MPDGITITYGAVDVQGNWASVAIPRHGLASAFDPEFDPPHFVAYADGVDRRFVAVTSCGEWCENLNVVIELVWTEGTWSVHGVGMHLATDDFTWSAFDRWLRPLKGSIRLQSVDADGDPYVACSLNLAADVENPCDRHPCHFALNAAFKVAFPPALPVAPSIVEAYAEAAASTARR